MCGIIHVKRLGAGRAAKMAVKRYHQQEKRGTEGYGFVGIVKGKVMRFAKSDVARPIISAILEKQEDEILLHHRNPTSTPNYRELAHPILVRNKKLKHDYYIVHNGSIRGVEDMKKLHDKEGFIYNTLIKQYNLTQEKRAYVVGEQWNDSESFAIELAKDLDGSMLGIPDVDGTIAFVALQVDKKTKQLVRTFWGRNYGSPLKYLKTKDYLTITSEGPGEEVKAHTLNWYDYGTKETQSLGLEYRIGYTAYGQSGDYRNGSYRGSDPVRDAIRAEAASEMHGASVNERNTHESLLQRHENFVSEAKQGFPYSPKKEPMGFRKPDVMLIGGPKDPKEEYELEQYMEDKKELAELIIQMDRASHAMDDDPNEMYAYLMDRRENLKLACKIYEESHGIPSPYMGA